MVPLPPGLGSSSFGFFFEDVDVGGCEIGGSGSVLSRSESIVS